MIWSLLAFLWVTFGGSWLDIDVRGHNYFDQTRHRWLTPNTAVISGCVHLCWLVKHTLNVVTLLPILYIDGSVKDRMAISRKSWRRSVLAALQREGSLPAPYIGLLFTKLSVRSDFANSRKTQDIGFFLSGPTKNNSLTSLAMVLELWKILMKALFVDYSSPLFFKN